MFGVYGFRVYGFRAWGFPTISSEINMSINQESTVCARFWFLSCP